MNNLNFLSALAQLGQAQRPAPTVQLDANGMPLPLMQAMQSYGPDVQLALNGGVDPRVTNAQREKMALDAANANAMAGGTVPPTFVPGSQSQFGGYTGAPRGRPMPPAEMLRKR